MFGHFILIALRNLNRFRFYTLINVIGLTLGITIFLLILFYVRYEYSFDRFNENAERIYRVDWNLSFGENSSHNAAVTPPMAEVLVREFPEIQAAVRFRYMGAFHFKRQTENIVEWRVIYADKDLFRIFTIPFLSGDSSTALSEPNSIVLTRSAANQFFPNEDAVGKTLIQDNATLLKVTGVVEDLPAESHFHYRMFLSMEALEEARNGNWIGGPYNTYLLLNPGADAMQLEKKLATIVNNHVLPQASSTLGKQFMEEFMQEGNSLKLELRPLLDIHLYSHLRNELEGNSDIKYVYLFSAVAFIVLALACINFVNLSTARSIKRAREVGIRKVLGSGRRKLAAQFFAESMIISISSSLIALVVVRGMLHVFNNITELHLSLNTTDPITWAFTLGTGIFVGIMAGLYPAVVLSSYSPVNVLKGHFIPGNNTFNLRSGLVVFQFTLSIALIIITLSLDKQMKFMQERKIGFKKEQVILMHDVDNAAAKLSTFRDEVLRHPEVSSGTISSYFPGPGSARKTPLLWRYGSDPSPSSSVNMETWTVDQYYIPTLGIELLEGRNFSTDFPSDSNTVILNETAALSFGFDADILGQKICNYFENPDGSQDNSRIEVWTIIGIVKDFNYESLRQRVEPLGLFFGRSSSFIAFRHNSLETEKVIDLLEAEWKKAAAGEPFHYSFLDEKFNTFYKTDQKVRDIFWVFSSLAIVIGCLGLLALTAFSAEQKTKEIGIRKVLGATSGDILIMLSTRFTLLVVVGFLLAIPIGAFCIDWYLQQYVDKAKIGLSVYAIAGFAAFMLALITIIYHALHAAQNNPVDALKME